MLILSMFLKGCSLFLYLIYTKYYIGFCHRTNVAVPFFIRIPLFIFRDQSRVSVNHDTTHQVLEKKLHEHHIDDVEEEPSKDKFLHVISNSSTCVNC